VGIIVGTEIIVEENIYVSDWIKMDLGVLWGYVYHYWLVPMNNYQSVLGI